MKPVWLGLVLVCGLCILNACGGASGAGTPQPIATHFSITSQGNVVAGTAFNISVTALDASNNAVATYSGTVHFTSSDAQAVLPAASRLSNGTATFSVTLLTLGSQTITATDSNSSSITGTTNPVTVLDSATLFFVTAPLNSTAGFAFNISVTATDAANHTVTTYTGTIHFTSSDAKALLPPDSTLTNGNGTFPITLNTLGTQTITATDTNTASITGNSSITVVTNVATQLSVVFPPSGWSPGNPLHFTVTALDAANNASASYAGTVHFTSTDAAASLPSNSTLTNGTANFGATLNTVGHQTITATDTVNASITGTSRSINIAKLTISGTPPNGAVGVQYSAGSENCTQQPGFLLQASGGWAFHGLYSFSSSSLPPGLQIGEFAQNGAGPDCRPGLPPEWILFGTPTQAGTFNSTISVTDNEPVTTSTSYLITISSAGTKAGAEDKLSLGQHHHYKLIGLGTFGGPQSRVDYQYPINNAGRISGSADTADPNPFYGNDNPFFFSDPFIQHAFLWKDGFLSDLGSLPGGGTSQPNWINEKGDVAGNASNGVIDPLGDGYPESRAVLYKNGQVIDLGTLGGYESASTAIDSDGTVVGFAANAIPDPIFGQQLRAFRWQDGVMQDLGTLGTGADALAITMNESGQIAGLSFTNDVPVTDPFLWENGKMIDLGGLGGTNSDAFEGPFMNNRGQVVGDSNLAGDVYSHPYLWTKPGPMRDLGTLGGNYGEANWVNDSGEVVGWATNAGDQAVLAFFWKNGNMVNLGTVDGDSCSAAWGLNEKQQVVGASGDCNQNLHAFLWEKGSTVDLNTLIPPGSDVQLNYATHISERGEITVIGTFPNGNNQGFLLIPCDENHSDLEGCDYSMVDAVTQPAARPSVGKISSPILPSAPWLRNNRFRFRVMCSKN